MRDHTQLIALFDAVQLSNLFVDSKTFCDAVPTSDLASIEADFELKKASSNFDLSAFVQQHFILPEKFASSFIADKNSTVEAHIDKLWPVLLRQPDAPNNGTLLALPHEYIVPGGRFGEIYYWDSYFTMLGLKAAGKVDLIEHMIQNFAFLIQTIGYIPNGNRTYYIGRSQPPFFALMVELLASIKGTQVLSAYLPMMEKEYAFWMNENQAIEMQGGGKLNRYWDENTTPRPEAYKEDIELAAHAEASSENIYRHIRAAAASGWDFSTRWFKDPANFSSIHTTEIIPVDLNTLLYMVEDILEKTYQLNGATEKAEQVKKQKIKRSDLIHQYCWDSSKNIFCDYDFVQAKSKDTISLAMSFPLFAKIASPEQAAYIAKCIEEKCLFEGGLVTTINESGQQWDSPNGWAPLQWITVQGLINYGYVDLANTIMERWLRLNRKVFARTGKMMEKYNVVNTSLEAGGGEYEGQDGFGWTNGVFLAMRAII